MKSFHIQIYSPLAFIGVISAVVMVGTLGIRYLWNEADPIVVGVLIALVVGCGFFVSSHLSTAKVQIKVDEIGFHHTWVKRFPFDREPDIHLPWGQVIDYFFMEDRTYCTFQLTLEHKQRYRLHRQTIWPVKDDFHSFRKSFPMLIRNMGTIEGQPIGLGKTIYEERWFKYALPFMAIAILLLLVISAIRGGDGSNWAILAMLVAAVTFYWIQDRIKGKGK